MISAQKSVEFQKSEYDKLKSVLDQDLSQLARYGKEHHHGIRYEGATDDVPRCEKMLPVMMICLDDATDTPEKGVLGMQKVLLKDTWTAA